MARFFVARTTRCYRSKRIATRRRNRVILYGDIARAVDNTDDVSDRDNASEGDTSTASIATHGTFSNTATDTSSDDETPNNYSSPEYSTNFITVYCNEKWPEWTRAVGDEIMHTCRTILLRPSDEKTALLTALEEVSIKMTKVHSSITCLI